LPPQGFIELLGLAKAMMMPKEVGDNGEIGVSGGAQIPRWVFITWTSWP
jgi:hypothetical protein